MQSGYHTFGVTTPRQAFSLSQRIKGHRLARDSRAGNFIDNKNEKESA